MKFRLIRLVLFAIAFSIARAFCRNKVIDDNFCDCDDGSDEPNTSACSHKKSQFICRIGNSLNISIASSRVSDGVCDCCDGADELIDLGCPNTCFKDLSSLRQDALLSYRKIQNGIRAKHDILEVIRRKEIMEQRSFDFLFQERKEITNLWLLLKLWLRREEQSDTRQQLRLLRERESRCALGDEQACDLFHPNWLDGDTLPEDGFRSIYANPRHRTDYQHSREEIQQVERLSGLERIRATLCLSKSLMPDESARVFTSVGEYEKFFSNTASSAILTKSSSQMKRETLFGPFLEFGERGYIEAACAASELIGIVLSPLTLSVRLFLKMLEVTWSFCWRQADFCQSNSECPYLLRLISMELMTIDSEDSIFFPLIQFFDLSSNGLFNDITEWLVLRFHVPLWVGSIAWRSPVMYWDYYVMGRGNELPPRRNTCLLKAGVQEAEIQLMDVIQKLKEKEEAREVALGGSGHSKSTKKLKLQKNSSSIDFGKDRIWESVSRLCLEGTFEQYKYKLCLFDTVKQDKLLIGKFLGWGGIGDLVDMSDAVSSKRSNSRRKRALVLRDLNADGINRKSTPGYYRSQVYSDGSICQSSSNRTERMAEVVFECGPDNRLNSVQELEKCVYFIVVQTPLVCNDEDLSSATKRLNELQVFGFAKSSVVVEQP